MGITMTTSPWNLTRDSITVLPMCFQISKRYDNWNCQYSGFEGSRNLAIGHLIRCRNGPLGPYQLSVRPANNLSIITETERNFLKYRSVGWQTLDHCEWRFRRHLINITIVRAILKIQTAQMTGRNFFFFFFFFWGGGEDSIYKYHLITMGNSIVEIKRSDDRLISTMGFSTLVR